jgi:hypothetical protein
MQLKFRADLNAQWRSTGHVTVPLKLSLAWQALAGGTLQVSEAFDVTCLQERGPYRMAEVNVHPRTSPRGLSLQRNAELGFKVMWSLEGNRHTSVRTADGTLLLLPQSACTARWLTAPF